MAAVSRTRLLLIEDELSVARVTELVLRTEGYEVDIGSDYASAADMLATKGYDLVLADTERGPLTRALSGLTAFARAAAPTPVVLFSAHRFSSQEIDAAGLVGAIPKPYDVDDLLRAVLDALKRRPFPPQGTEAAPPG